MRVNIFHTLDQINKRLATLERKVTEIDNRTKQEMAIIRNHLVRIKNGEILDDSFLLRGSPYRDISPGDALSIYQDMDKNYIFLDVTENNFVNDFKINEAIHIPLSELPIRYIELNNYKSTPIMIISEEGIGSIHACELLISKGHYNLNNISGGYLHWPMDPQNRPITSIY